MNNFCSFSILAVVVLGATNLTEFSSLIQRYHPSRVLTLVYQPFALGVLAILTYKEAKINTRQRNLFGYTLFFISALLVLVVSSLITWCYTKLAP